MIDIHCHLLYGVDDGPETIEESIDMLKIAKEQGIDAIILTPHYRRRMFPYNKECIFAHMRELQPYAKKIGIDIYLGTEYHVNSSMVEHLESGKCLPLADTNCVLTEYEYETEYSYIKKMTQELMFHGYTPVIAHVERYGCLLKDIDKIAELSKMGAWIQVNADAILGNDGWRMKQFCKKLLKADLIDVVASDSHGIKKRACHMGKCREYVAKKYGEDTAQVLFEENPAMIINIGD